MHFLREFHITFKENVLVFFFVFKKFVLKAFSNSDAVYSFKTLLINESRAKMHFHLSESTHAIQS